MGPATGGIPYAAGVSIGVVFMEPSTSKKTKSRSGV
jgi:hypothetical protein